MDFEFDKRSAEYLAAHACGQYRFACIAHSRCVGEELHPFAVDMSEHIVGGLIHHVDSLHCDRNHFRTGGNDGFKHLFGRGELAGAHKEA